MQRLTELGEQIEKRLEKQFELRFGQIEGRLGQIESRFAQIEGRLDHIENRIDQQNRLFILAWVTLIATVVGMGLR
jgi:hypothetical protein